MTRADGQRLILVGRVTGAFGVRGELRLAAYTENPLALADYGRLLGADGALALTVLSARTAKGGVIARAREVTTPEQAEALRGLELYVERAALPAPDEDEFYLADLIGLAAQDPAGAPLGRVVAVRDFGAGDLLEIKPEGAASWWVAFTREAVPEVRLDQGVVVIDRPAETPDRDED